MAMALEPRGEHIKHLLDESDLSVRQFARLLGFQDHQKVSNWLNGDNKPRDEGMWEEMLRIATREHTRRFGTKRPVPMPMKPLRIVGLVAAGGGIFNVDTDVGQVMVPANLAGDDKLGWEVEGDSMMPSLEPGDIAVFREWSKPLPRYAYLIRTKEGLKCKKLLWDRDSSRFVMESINPNYARETMEDAQILGLLIGYYRVRGSREKFEADPEGLILD